MARAGEGRIASERGWKEPQSVRASLPRAITSERVSGGAGEFGEPERERERMAAVDTVCLCERKSEMKESERARERSRIGICGLVGDVVTVAVIGKRASIEFQPRLNIRARLRERERAPATMQISPADVYYYNGNLYTSACAHACVAGRANEHTRERST